MTVELIDYWCPACHHRWQSDWLPVCPCCGSGRLTQTRSWPKGVEKPWEREDE